MNSLIHSISVLSHKYQGKSFDITLCMPLRTTFKPCLTNLFLSLHSQNICCCIQAEAYHLYACMMPFPYVVMSLMIQATWLCNDFLLCTIEKGGFFDAGAIFCMTHFCG